MLVADPHRQLDDPVRGNLEAGRVVDLRTDMRVQSREVKAGAGQHAADRLIRRPGGERESEFLVIMRGGYVLMRGGLHARGDANQDSRPAAGPGRSGKAGQAPDLLERIGHDMPDPGRQRALKLSRQLVAAVQRDHLSRHPGPERDLKLSAGADVDAEPLFGHPAKDRLAAERLGRVRHPGTGAECLVELAAATPEVRLVAGEKRGPELRGKSVHADAAQDQGAAGAPRRPRPDRRVERVQVRWHRRRVAGRQYVGMAGSRRMGDAAHRTPLVKVRPVNIRLVKVRRW